MSRRSEDGRGPTVDGQVDAGDVGGVVTGEEEGSPGDVLGLAEAAQRDPSPFQVEGAARLGEQVLRGRGAGQRGADRVDPDAEATALDGELGRAPCRERV